MILKNVEIMWAHLEPENPDGGFDKETPQWNLQAITRDKAQAEDWKSSGLSPKPDSDDTGLMFKINVKKLCTQKNGQPNKPVAVVGTDLMPIEDVSVIGNGSVGNVKVRTFDYDFNGRQGVGVRLDAVQITKLVEYKAAGGAILEGFEAFDADDTSTDDYDAY